jgi:lysophospholipase L1-like esterase
MIKPFKIFLFGLSVLILCFVLSLCVPGGTLSLGSHTIRIPVFSFQTPAKQSKLKDISSIIAISSLINNSTDTIFRVDTIARKDNDSTHRVYFYPVPQISADSIRKLFRSIEYAQGSDTVLFSFFDDLSKCSDQLIRVLHYGDSQIEGDRITSYLRNQLQLNFGGEGIGLIPVVAVNPAAISFVYDISGNWEKFSPQQNTGNSRKYGVMLNYARINSGGHFFSKNKEVEGWINLKHANISYPSAQRYRQCQVFYGYNKAPMMVELKQKEAIIDADIIPTGTGLKRLKWQLDKPLKDVTITIKTSETPDVYAISLDGLSGVAVDNIPVRGSSGLEFTKSDASFLKNFYKLLNVRMLILQFGVNVVPNIRTNYDFYKNNFYEQLKLLKQMRPNLPIIVIGVSDVSRNGTNGFESYPNIELIRDAQKNAAFAAGCAFWDIYEAMGGKNSMPSWVNANPPLAQKDFIHFNPVGAKIIAEMFYRALMMEYERFLNKQSKDLSLTCNDKN